MVSFKRKTHWIDFDYNLCHSLVQRFTFTRGLCMMLYVDFSSGAQVAVVRPQSLTHAQFHRALYKENWRPDCSENHLLHIGETTSAVLGGGFMGARMRSRGDGGAQGAIKTNVGGGLNIGGRDYLKLYINVSICVRIIIHGGMKIIIVYWQVFWSV